jgi:hypothetical protein
MFILNEVETSHILISIRLYFILTILITEDEPQPSILSDCNFSSSAGEVSGTQGLWEEGSDGTSVRDPESQERAHESLKGPIDILFWFFHYYFFLYFQLKIHNFERSFSLSSGPKAVLLCLAKFLLEALVQSVDKSLRFVMAQLVRHLVCLVYWSDMIISYVVYSTEQ